MTDTELDELHKLRQDMDARFDRQGEKLEAFRAFLLRGFAVFALSVSGGIGAVAVIAGGTLSEIESNDERSRDALAIAQTANERAARLEGERRVDEERWRQVKEILNRLDERSEEQERRTRALESGGPRP